MKTPGASRRTLTALAAIHASQRARRVAALARSTSNLFRRTLWCEMGRTL